MLITKTVKIKWRKDNKEWYKFKEYELHDRYKRFITYKNKYEYLEISYWVFDKNDTYKELIDDKLNEILIVKEVI